MKIIKVPIEKCELWDKNPRGITKKDFDRLKRQIKKLGVYKPLVACEENGKYVILGGNMRLRALKELGFKEVELSVVEAKTEEEKIEYSLSDNDRAGYYEEDALAELVAGVADKIHLDDYKIDLGDAKSLGQVLAAYLPEEEDEEPEVEFTEELLESHNFIVLYFDNEVDWLQAQSLFELKEVKAKHWQPGFDTRGIGRVVNGARALEMLRQKLGELRGR